MNEQDKRFEAAKAAMQGLLMTRTFIVGNQIDSVNLVHKAIEMAEELLTQMNEKNIPK
jgi:hypothetical protein